MSAYVKSVISLLWPVMSYLVHCVLTGSCLVFLADCFYYFAVAGCLCVCGYVGVGVFVWEREEKGRLATPSRLPFVSSGCNLIYISLQSISS